MTGKGKDGHGKTAESWHCTLPFNDAHRSSVHHRVPQDEMIHDQNHQVPNTHQRRDAGVFQRVQPAKVGQRDDDQHKRRDPEMPVQHVLLTPE